MKRSLLALCLLITMSIISLGGEVNTPGKASPTPSPTPCDTCAGTSTINTTEPDPMLYELIVIGISLVLP